MARTSEKQAFAERLKQALTRSSKRIETPAELAVQFNLCYVGKSVTNQAVQKWLSGENRPTPDKIETLAKMLNVPYNWLRYGIVEAQPVSTDRAVQEESTEVIATPEELHLIALYRQLSAYQQGLITGLIEQLTWNINR